MSANPYHDGSDNPYAEGGRSTTPAASHQLWFCHQCSADFHQINDTREPTCPQCGGAFVERIEDSIDDPHQFDRPDDNAGFAMFGGPNDATQAGNAQSPFFQLMQHFMGNAAQSGFFPMPLHAQTPNPSMQQQGSGQQESSPLSPSATQRQAGHHIQQTSQPHSFTSTAPSVMTPQEQSHREDSANRSSSSSGGFRTGPVTFTWSNTTTTNRPPPRETSPSAETNPNEHTQDGRDDGPTQTNIPIRNLASFLQGAFAPTPASDNPQPERLRAQSAPQSQFPNDPLAAILSQLAANFGVPLGVNNGNQPGAAQQGQTQQHQHQHQQQQQQPSQQSGQPGFSRVIFGTPGHGQGAVFTFTAGRGRQGQPDGLQGMPFPLAMLTGFAGHGGDGRMGDYVFSQGAMDNIITELMNQANGRYGPQPAPEQMIKDLPRVKMTSELVSAESVQDCAVCKDDFQIDDEAVKLPCSHLFHTDCITPWLERNGTCPVCRYQLVEQPEPSRGTTALFGTQDAAQPSGSIPVSPSLPQSPPIAVGSSMPSAAGGFFTSIFNAVTGNRSNASNSGSQSGSQQAQGNPQPQRTQQQNDATQPDLDLDLD